MVNIKYIYNLKAKKLKKIIPIVILLMTFCMQINARHIVGGEMYYKCNGVQDGNMNISVELILYRDASVESTLFDASAEIGIYQSGSGNTWEYFNTYTTKAPVTEALDSNSGTPCLSAVPNIQVEKGLYKFDLTLPVSNKSYLLSYTRCCRVQGISNIVNSGNQGARYYVEITPEAQTSCDSSPRFTNLPPSVICVNEDLDFSFKTSDGNAGDVVKYSMCSPTAGGGPFGSNQNPGDARGCNGIKPDPQRCGQVIKGLPFGSGYSFDNPIRGSKPISIDENTGQMTGFPEVQGVYALAVCATSYNASGEELTTIKRDFQINVTECKKEIIASIKDQVQLGSDFEIKSCTGNTVQLINGRLSNEKFVESYDWEIIVNNGSKLSQRSIDALFNLPDLGTYNGKLVINRNSIFENCRDSVEFVLNVFPEVEAGLDIEYDICSHKPVELKDKSIARESFIVDYNWSVDTKDIGKSKNTSLWINEAGKHLIKHKIIDNNGCKDSITQVIDYYPLPNNLEVEISAIDNCVPSTQKFIPKGSIINDEYIVEWTIDGEKYKNYSPSVNLTRPGKIDVFLEVKSPIGNCGLAKAYKQNILLVSPIADFTYSPQYITQFDNGVQFTSKSKNVDRYQWNIEDFITPAKNPYVEFKDTGYQNITHIAINDNGCRDTLTKKLDVIPMTTFFMPNAFTPNGDEKNDVFKGKGFTQNILDFDMVIFNRWGEKVYETQKINEGWDGKLPGGSDAPSGSYTYKVKYRAVRNFEKELRGNLLLIR